MAMQVSTDFVVFCVRCPWSTYLVAGADEIPDEDGCPHCGDDVAVLPEMRTERVKLDTEELVREAEQRQRRRDAVLEEVKRN